MASLAVMLATTPSHGQCTPRWLPAPGLPASDASISALTPWDADGPGPGAEVMAAAGSFVTAGGMAARSVAAWNGASWQAFGVGLPGQVHALAAFQNRLYAGASYESGGITVWNGASWEPVGGGVLGAVVALTVFDGRLIAAGSFPSAGSIVAQNVAAWDGNGWSALGPGIPGQPTRPATVVALTVHAGELYAAGVFPNENVARWTGSSWVSVGGGIPYPTFGSANASSLASFGGRLFVGGQFSRVGGGVSAANIAAWDGSTWAPVGGGVDIVVSDLFPIESGLLVAGRFTAAGGKPAGGVALWDGANWTPWGMVSGGAFGVGALGRFGGQVFAGGNFTHADSADVSRVARWDSAQWRALVEQGPVVHAAVEYGGELVIGGTFAAGGGVDGTNIASWNGSTWKAWTSSVAPSKISDGSIRDLLVTAGGQLIAAGSFGPPGSGNPARVAVRSGSAWQSLGAGIGASDPGAEVVELIDWQGRIVAGGKFADAGGAPAANIAAWNGAAWSPLGTGTNAPVLALAALESDLIAGGEFTTAGGASASRVARWNGSGWSPMGAGLDAPVRALVENGGRVYAGGDFTVGGGIARWTGATWEPVGLGVDGRVEALWSTGTQVYAAGAFTRAGSLASAGLAVWDGSAWLPLAEGVSGGPVLDLTGFKGDLIAAGAFGRAGGVAAPALARWSRGAPPGIALHPRSQSVRARDTALFEVKLLPGYEPGARYQWFKDGAAVRDGPAGASPGGGTVTGATEATMRISLVAAADAGRYWCEVSTPCGGVRTADAILTVLLCVPDCNGDSKLDIQDFTCFQGAVALGALSRADVGGFATCAPDGQLNIQDFMCFQNLFALGCP